MIDAEYNIAVLGVSNLVYRELESAVSKHGRFNSAHEGFAVLKEEVDELWDIVKQKQNERDLGKMQKEAVQIAAMAYRFAVELCTEERGRK